MLLLVSTAVAATPAFGGILKPSLPQAFVFWTSTDASGGLHLVQPSMPALPSGSLVVLQAVIADGSLPSGAVLSNALSGTVP